MNEKGAAPRLPKLRTGMLLEILTPNNRLIFVGRAEVLDADQLQVTEEHGEKVPWVEYNTQVKLRGFQSDGTGFSLCGYVSGSTEQLWRIDRLEPLQTAGEQRKFFRQTVNLPGTVMCVNQIFSSQARRMDTPEAAAVKCTVLDISGGGVRFQCQSDCGFQVGDWLFFSMEHPLEESVLNYTCCVRRISEDQPMNEYGCEFSGLTEQEQESLLRMVMLVQQKELRSRRQTSRE